MRMKHLLCYFLPLLLLCLLPHSQAQPNTTGYECSANRSIYPCRTYAHYRALAPDLDLATIGDLFGISRLMIAKPSNISSPSSPLVPEQSLFVPLTCSCVSNNNHSYANLNYTIKKGDTFWFVSTTHFQNLTTYQAVEVVNPTFVPTKLEVGDEIVFPIFCKCPNETQFQNSINYLVTYVFQASDTLDSIASRFGLERQSLIDVNGANISTSDTMFLPFSQLPNLTQPSASAPAPAPVLPPSVSPISTGKEERKGLIIGLSIGLGVACFLLILSILIMGLWSYRESKGTSKDKEKQMQFGQAKILKKGEENIMAGVSDCLDRYRVYSIQEVREATDGFDPSYVIHGSVYKGYIDGELYAIKKMKWNACEELKILQKVNHGNLVKLEGFCIDPEDGNCYLVYEHVENGSLHSWLHDDNRTRNLDWKHRLRIAIDVANGLQYIHEHTRPRVVHKDIKTSNILLDGNMRAKIANFGLAKSGCNAITTHIVGTQGYIAPEYLIDGVVTTKMDVFAFGVVLLELLSGKEAINEEGKLLWTSIDGILEGGEDEEDEKLKAWMDEALGKESCSIEGVMNVMAVATACLHRDPSKRPSMVDVVYALCKSDDLCLDFSEDGLSVTSVSAR